MKHFRTSIWAILLIMTLMITVTSSIQAVSAPGQGGCDSCGEFRSLTTQTNKTNQSSPDNQTDHPFPFTILNKTYIDNSTGPITSGVERNWYFVALMACPIHRVEMFVLMVLRLMWSRNEIEGNAAEFLSICEASFTKFLRLSFKHWGKSNTKFKQHRQYSGKDEIRQLN